jgi:hypothetical protein
LPKQHCKQWGRGLNHFLITPAFANRLGSPLSTQCYCLTLSKCSSLVEQNYTMPIPCTSTRLHLSGIPNVSNLVPSCCRKGNRSSVRLNLKAGNSNSLELKNSLLTHNSMLFHCGVVVLILAVLDSILRVY